LEAREAEPIGLFEIAKVGLPIAVVGLTFLIVFAPMIVPARRAPGEDVGSTAAREFTVEMTVQPDGTVAGKSVAEAGLRNLQGVFLIEVERDGHTIAPVRPQTRLEGGDRLIFAGNVARVLDLQRIPGLIAAEDKHFMVTEREHGRRFYEVVVSASSPLSGSTLKSAGFRARYQAAVFAIHRAGARIPGKLGDVRIGPGDVLLLVADGGWGRRWKDHRDFLVVSSLEGGPTLIPRKARIVGLVTLGLLLTVGTGVLDILPAALAAGLLLIALRVLTRTEARDSIDLEVVVAIAASFGLGAAMEASGLAEVLGDGLVTAFERLGDHGVLAGVLIGTVVLTELITNNAAAVLMFPIAFATATSAGMDPRPFAIAVAVGASASFLTPIGYQTNTMVYGMGGYRFSDFVRLGGALTPVMLLIALLVIPLGWPLRP
jgi:di/tricarboxylate transporter